MPDPTGGLIAGGAVISGLIGADAASSAADTQAAAANRASDLQYKMWQEQQALQEPWRQAGITALNKLIPEATTYTPFGMEQFKEDPGYQFRLQEGLKALDRQAAARGGLISGSALKAAARYGQEAGSQEYQNAFNRYQAERAARLSPLQSLAGVGQTTAQTLASQAGQYGTNVGNLEAQAANARASGYIGGANALTSAMTGGFGAYQQNLQGERQNQLLNRLIGGSGGGGYLSMPSYSQNYLEGQFNPMG